MKERDRLDREAFEQSQAMRPSPMVHWTLSARTFEKDMDELGQPYEALAVQLLWEGYQACAAHIRATEVEVLREALIECGNHIIAARASLLETYQLKDIAKASAHFDGAIEEAQEALAATGGS